MYRSGSTAHLDGARFRSDKIKVKFDQKSTDILC